jgi:hypothetical protein
VLGDTIKSINLSNRAEECHEFLIIAAEVLIQHDCQKSLICSKYALKIKIDTSVRQFIFEALLKHLNLPSSSILEQNNILN